MEGLKQVSGLTDQESLVMDSISQGYNEWLKLEMTHPCEMQDFVNAIHNIQSILAMRVIRKNYPEYWLTYKK